MKIATRPFRSHRRRAARVLAAVALGAGALSGAVPASADAAGGTATAVTYTMEADWGFGFQAQITITPGEAVTGGWTLSFDAGDQQAITLAAYAASAQSGRRVTLSNRVFNADIPAGTTLSLVVQFNNPTFSDVPPTAFVFNGRPADYTPSPYLVVSQSRPTVPEGGSSAVAVALSRRPGADVGLSVESSAAPAVGVAPQRLTFTPDTWDIPQTVLISSPVDSDTTDETAYIQIEQQSGTSLFFSGDVLLATQIDQG